MTSANGSTVVAAAQSIHGGAEALAEKQRQSTERSAKRQAMMKAKQEALEVEKGARHRELAAALAAERLQLRSDSWLCEQYIDGNKNLTLAHVVATMKKMNVLYSPPINFAQKWDAFCNFMRNVHGRGWLEEAGASSFVELKEVLKDQAWAAYEAGADMTKFSFSV